MAEFPTTVTDGSDSVLIWGADRTAAALCAYAVARRSKGTLVWLFIRDPITTADANEAVLAQFVPPESRYSTGSLRDLGPSNPEDNPALWSVIRADEPAEQVASLLDFLRLPRALHSITSRLPTPSTPLVFFATNVDRIVHLYPEDVELTRRFHEASKAQGVKLVASFAGPERKDRFAFGNVFHLVPGPSQDWGAWSLVHEGPNLPAGAAGEQPTPLEQVDSIRVLLTEAGLRKHGTDPR
ncbi:MAG: hypothetical protein L3J87_00365 [Thermoplasmata archaeon]|nr:hypothetical protein [Thermoplasmata archaeon]